MKRILLILVIFGVAEVCAAQSLSMRRAERLFAAKSYSDAIPRYKKVVESDSANKTAVHRLAECYRLVEDYTNAAATYALLEKRGWIEGREPYFYSQMLMHLGSFDLASNVAKRYAPKSGNDPVYANILDAIDNQRPYYFEDTVGFSIENLKSINTKSSEIGASFFGSSIIYSSNSYVNDHFGNRHGWTGSDFYSLWECKGGQKPLVHSELNSRYNNGPAFFSPSESKLYITQNLTSYFKIRKQERHESILRVMVYSFDSLRRVWVNEQPFVYNNNSYNVAHVAINERGDVLAFASDMPNGFGGMDIYLSYKKDGVWSAPINAGANVNTSGNEVFPSFYGNGVIFFSSDGQRVHGGLDILYAKIGTNGVGSPRIIPLPVNSNNDDFGIQFSADKRTALFASNRKGGVGDDDIYLLKLNRPFSTDYLIKGVAIDSDTKKILPAATITLADTLGGKLGSVVSDSLGKFSFIVEDPISFRVNGAKVSYIDGVASSSFPKGKNVAEVTVPLTPTFGVSLYALIVDKRTAKPLDKVKVVMVDAKSGKPFFEYDTDESGSFTKQLEGVKVNDVLSYKITLERSGYIPKALTYTKRIVRPGQIDMMSELDIALEPFEVGKDIGKLININPIYFDLSKWNIRPDAAAELDKIVKIMLENPTMEIELGSHTDCRSSAKFNQNLSEKRARSSTEYIVNKGISAARITYKGYGESRLINKCACEGSKKSSCPESEHAKNRRTEFVITKL